LNGNLVAKILVVEDSSVDRLLVGSLLSRQQNWHIEYAHNGREAIERLETEGQVLPDVIVTDLRMPEMDGLELVRAIRESYPQVPVVLITSYGSEQIAIEALRSGATNFSPKSSLQTDLVRTVGQVLELARHMKFTRNPDLHPSSKQIAFVLENELSLIGPTIEHLQENLPRWSDRDRLQIGMALDEAIVNAMHHGNLEVESSLREGENENKYYETIRQRKSRPPYCHRRVRIEAEFSDQHICVQISDDGQGFDPQLVPDPTAEENLHRASGRGLFLIRSFMDQVAYNKAGNQITMTKLREKEAAV
jgi:CheY-like chemotaxis protein/anti-sigma regulatory factor (Ser/Thr protein kinase)